jgi:hypothetical protein
LNKIALICQSLFKKSLMSKSINNHRQATQRIFLNSIKELIIGSVMWYVYAV